jgi:hypothetical protein
MDRYRTRFVDSFLARSADGMRVRVDVVATEKNTSSVKIGGKWVEVSRTLRTADGDAVTSGPGDNFTRTLDGTVLRRER